MPEERSFDPLELSSKENEIQLALPLEFYKSYQLHPLYKAF